MTGEAQYDYKIERILRVKDGDTFVCIVSKDIGFHMTAQATITVRVMWVDTYELHKGSAEWRDLAVKATDFTIHWLDENLEKARITTIEEDGFGRWLGYVYVPDGGPVLGKDLIDAGYQKPGSKWGPEANPSIVAAI